MEVSEARVWRWRNENAHLKRLLADAMLNKPMQNGFIESGRLRDELHNETLFSSLAQGRVATTRWRVDSNTTRPHSQIAWHTADEFARTFRPHQPIVLRYANGFARATVGSTAQQGKINAGKNSEMDRNWGKRHHSLTWKLTKADPRIGSHVFSSRVLILNLCQ